MHSIKSRLFTAAHRFRRLWLTLLVAVPVSALLLVIWSSRDEPPPDVSDFHFAPLQLPDDQNAYAVITKAAQLLPPHEWTSDEEDAIDVMLKHGAWNEDIAQTCIANLAPVWPLLERAKQIPKGQTPWISALSDTIPELSPTRNLSRLIQIKALSQARSGNPNEGLRTALIAVTIGHQIEESRGSLIHYLYGVSIKQSGLTTLREIAVNYTLSDAAIKDALRTISACRASKRALTLAFHSELRVFEDGLRIIRNDKSGAQLDGATRPLIRLLPRSLMLKENKTRRIYVECMRTSVEAIDLPLSDQQAMLSPLKLSLKSIRKPSALYPENFIGRTYLGIIIPSTDRLLTNRLRAQSKISGYEALLAAQLYRNGKGELPATLDLLVPNYLPSIPRDYMDGAPIRYSRDLGVIWSVGEKNLSITQLDQQMDAKELAIYLNPRPEQTTTR